MRRAPLVISPAKRDVMRHMLLDGVRPRDIAKVLELRSQDQVRFRPRKRASVSSGSGVRP